MPRTTRATRNETSLDDEWVQHIIRRAVVAAILCDPKGAETLIEIPDAALGRLLKNHLCQVAGLATVYGIDLVALLEEENLRKRAKRTSKQSTENEALPGPSKSNAERYPLVLQGKVLRTSDFCKAADITEKKLQSLVASSRMFLVYFGAEHYCPAFFLSSMIFRDDFRKVIRCLGKTAPWAMFDFFTTPVESLGAGGATPLQRLSVEDVEPVIQEAKHFAEQWARMHTGTGP